MYRVKLNLLHIYTGFTFATVSRELSVVIFMVPIQLTLYSVNMAPFQLPHCSFCFCGPSTINVIFSLCGPSPDHSQLSFFGHCFSIPIPCPFAYDLNNSAILWLYSRVTKHILKYVLLYKPIPVAARSKAYVCGRSRAEIVGSNPSGGMDVCVVSVVCCQVEVSATSWSLIQMSRIDYGASLCDTETSWMGRPWLTGGQSRPKTSVVARLLSFRMWHRQM